MTHPVSLTLLAQCSSNFLPHTYCNNDISERTIGRNNLASCGHSPCRDNHKHCDTCILLQQQGSKQHAQVKVQLTAPNSPHDHVLTAYLLYSAQWFTALYDKFRGRPELISNGFKEAGIAAALANQDQSAELSHEDPFADLD